MKDEAGLALYLTNEGLTLLCCARASPSILFALFLGLVSPGDSISVSKAGSALR